MAAGVTAINLEALQIMRRGAPPAGANPFPVALPLHAATAATGLAAAASVATAAVESAGGLSEQQAQQLVQQQGREAALCPARELASSGTPTSHAPAGADASSAFAPAALAWPSSPGDASAAATFARHPALGSYGCVTAPSPGRQQQPAQAAGTATWTGFNGRSPQQPQHQPGPVAASVSSLLPATGGMPRVFVERGPAAAAASASPPAGKAVGRTGAVRTAGTRRALPVGSMGTAAGCGGVSGASGSSAKP